MVKNRQKGITKAYRNDKKDVDTSTILNESSAKTLHTPRCTYIPARLPDFNY